MYSTGLLVFCSCRVLTAEGSTCSVSLSALLRAASSLVSSRLYVHLPPHKSYMSPSFYLPRVTRIYMTASEICPRLDVRVLLGHLKTTANTSAEVIHTNSLIDVVMTSSEAICDVTQLGDFVKQYRSTASSVSTVSLDDLVNEEHEKHPPALFRDEVNSTIRSDVGKESFYDHVAVGGTFDCIHIGHKCLLSAAILHCREKLTVGVSDAPLLVDKTLSELIAPVDERRVAVERLVQDLDYSVKCETVAIQDPLGPTRYDASMQVIVVSEETRGAVDAINKARESSSLAPLRAVKVALLPATTDRAPYNEFSYIFSDKLSSTNERIRQLGELRRQRPEKRLRESGPYVLGLTGGLASGKTAICEYLRHRGAHVIDCDKLGHCVYEKNTPGHAAVVETFGDSVLAVDGTIDRARLAAIVFADGGAQLKRLTDIVWPRIAQLVNRQVQEVANDRVVVLEAAVLLEAGWQEMCDEVWTVIVPDHEAIRRAVSRDKCSEQQASRRLNRQCGNVKRVAAAHVVFCSLWQSSFTLRQVEKAWDELIINLNQTRKE